MYLESNSPHQAVMIVCECICFSLVSNHHNLRHLCTLAMFRTQHANSLLLLIHVQVQCDIVITRNTCVNICSLNCFNSFWNIKLVRLVFFFLCVCVYACFGFKCLSFFLLRNVFESLKCCVDLWLSSMLDCIHVCVFLLFEKLFLSNLDSFSIPLDS